MTINSHYRELSLRYRAAATAAANVLLLVSTSICNSVGIAQSTDREMRRLAQMKSSADAAVAITSVRKLQVDDWLEQLEVDVKNLSHKPIYYLEISMTLPGLGSADVDGVLRAWAIDLAYGRLELMKEAPTSDDISIKPGESHTLKIPRGHAQALQTRLASGPVPASAVRKVFVRVEEIALGMGLDTRAEGCLSRNFRTPDESSPLPAPKLKFRGERDLFQI